MQKPSSESRHLYAGGRLGSKQVHPKLILGLTSEPSFDLLVAHDVIHTLPLLPLDPYQNARFSN